MRRTIPYLERRIQLLEIMIDELYSEVVDLRDIYDATGEETEVKRLEWMLERADGLLND